MDNETQIKEHIDQLSKSFVTEFKRLILPVLNEAGVVDICECWAGSVGVANLSTAISQVNEEKTIVLSECFKTIMAILGALFSVIQFAYNILPK